jgi:hypothetical protein
MEPEAAMSRDKLIQRAVEYRETRGSKKSKMAKFGAAAHMPRATNTHSVGVFNADLF